MDSNTTNLQQLWQIYTDWLGTYISNQYKQLNGPATDQDYTAFKQATGYDFPDDLRSLYEINNGANDNNSGINLVLWAHSFLSIDKIIEEWKSCQEFADDENMLPSSSYPEKAVKVTDFNDKWIPFLSDNSGNFIGLDLDPDANGTIGQIINFGRDENHHRVIAQSLENFFNLTLSQIRDNNVALIAENEGHEYWDFIDYDYIQYGVHLDIIEYGKQEKKIFFIPHIKAELDGNTREISTDWAGRILPGQTLFEGIQTELQQEHDYIGRFEVGSVAYLDSAKDNKGIDVQRYDIAIKLFPASAGEMAAVSTYVV